MRVPDKTVDEFFRIAAQGRDVIFSAPRLHDLIADLRDARAACREAVAKYFDHPDTQEAHDAEYEAMLKLRAVAGEEAKP